jgi:acyl-coenzyme A thioesterase PaaI-like protein
MHLALAKPGVCGHPDTAHGGVLATIIDEAMSLGVTLYAPEAGEAGKSGRIRSKMFTAQLDMRYKRPVAVPGDLEVRVSVLAKQGKKVWVRAQAVQKGEIMVDAVAFWLLVAPAPATKSVL